MSADISDPNLKSSEETVLASSNGDGALQPAAPILVLDRHSIIDSRYKVLEILGSGGMGTVYKVQHLIFNDVHALKVASSKLDPVSAQRFQREAVTAKLLDHENIVKVSDFGLMDGVVPYFAMQFVDGPSLSQLIREKTRLKVEDALEIFLQVCGAMSHAHDKGVIHRDLKPSNIIVSTQDEKVCAKVLDFGIAKLLTSDLEGQGLTRTGDVFGSPLYMSPEQCVGGKVDQRADIYSFGCSLYEALCGITPFAGESALHTMMLHQSAPLPSLKQASLGLIEEPELEKIIAKLLAKEQHNRYQSFDEVKLDLALLKNGKQPIIASQAMIVPDLDTKRKKELLPWIISVVILSALLVGLLAWICNDKFYVVPKQRLIAPSERFIAGESHKEIPRFSSTFTDEKGKKWKRFKFPPDVNLGLIQVGKKHEIPELDYTEYAATGELTVPGDVAISLLAQKDAIKNSTYLHGFGPDDLYGLSVKKMYMAVDDKFMHDIIHLKSLRSLILDLTEVTDESIDMINRHFPNLEKLYVGSSPMTGDGLSRLTRLGYLNSLRMGGNVRGGKVIPALKGSKNLKFLSISSCGLKDSDLDEVSSLSNLETLIMRENRAVTDAGLSKCVGLKNLMILDLKFCGITPASIKNLASFPKLRSLQISSEKWSPEDRQLLRKSLLKNCKLVETDAAEYEGKNLLN